MEAQPPMMFMGREREALDRLLPGLDAELVRIPLRELERPANGGLAAFRRMGGPALLVPTEHAGKGASALEAVRVQRAIGSRSPSLAVATTMHHFSVASLVAVSAHSTGFEWMLLEGIARDGRLVASGFAEGRPGQSILSPTMRAEPVDGGFLITGTKKPCSLSQSMDLLTASVALPSADPGGSRLAVALIPAADARIERRPFWNTPVLAGAESDEVRVNAVHVPDALIVRTDARPGEVLDDLQAVGFIWFELLMTASYLGAATRLVEGVLAGACGEPADRAAMAISLEAAMAAVEGAARAVDHGEMRERTLATALFVRYAAQDAIQRTVSAALELLGGMAFIASSDASYLASASSALAFHPPSRSRMHAALLDALGGHPLRMS